MMRDKEYIESFARVEEAYRNKWFSDHETFTPRWLCEKIADSLDLNGSILVLFNLEFALTFKYYSKINNITVYCECAERAKVAKHLGFEVIRELNMKFNNIIGNPPYEKNRYKKFWEIACKLSSNVVMLMPSGWWIKSEEEEKENYRLKGMYKVDFHGSPFIRIIGPKIGTPVRTAVAAFYHNSNNLSSKIIDTCDIHKETHTAAKYLKNNFNEYRVLIKTLGSNLDDLHRGYKAIATPILIKRNINVNTKNKVVFSFTSKISAQKFIDYIVSYEVSEKIRKYKLRTASYKTDKKLFEYIKYVE